jgi:hypothetical protein
MSNHHFDYSRYWQAAALPSVSVQVACMNCMHQSHISAAHLTLVVDPTEVQPTLVRFACPLCHCDNEAGPLPGPVVAQLLPYVTLAAARPLEPL